MNSSFNQVEFSGYKGFGIGPPFPQLMFQMSVPSSPPMISAHIPTYLAPNMNQGQIYNGMNYPINMEPPAMLFPMQYAYPTSLMSPHASPRGQNLTNGYPYSMVPTYQNGAALWPLFPNVSSGLQDVQPVLPISPYDFLKKIGHNHQPLVRAAQGAVMPPLELLTPISPTNTPIRRMKRKTVDDDEIVIPTKKLKNEYERETTGFLLPPPTCNSTRPIGVGPDSMSMPPPAPGTLFAGSMACNRHPEDMAALYTVARTQPLPSRPEKSQRILRSIRKRNEYIYSSELSQNVFPNGSNIRELMVHNGMLPSSSRALQQDVSARRNFLSKDKMSPIRTPVYFLPQNEMLPPRSNAHDQIDRTRAGEVVTLGEQSAENLHGSSSDTRVVKQ